MKPLFLSLVMALAAVLAPGSATADTANVVVVVNGNTEVNREAYKFLRQTFQTNHLPYNLTVTLDPSKVTAGQYKAVVVLNTGLAAGIDPVLGKFIGSYGGKKDVFLVNLYKNRTDLTVVSVAAASNPDGVDGVTAASTWTKGWGANNQVYQDMHLAWVKTLVAFLQHS